MNIDTTGIDKILRKLKAKDPTLFKAVQRKIFQISQLDYNEIMHFKNLKYGLSVFKRIHVGSFVLMFKVEEDVIIFAKFIHHDKAY